MSAADGSGGRGAGAARLPGALLVVPVGGVPEIGAGDDVAAALARALGLGARADDERPGVDPAATGQTTTGPTTTGPTTTDPAATDLPTTDLPTAGPTNADLATTDPATSGPTTSGPTTTGLATTDPAGVGADAAATGLREGDVLVVSAKLYSKSLDLRVPATHQAAAVLAQSTRVVSERATERGVTRVVECLAGPVLVAAGIDRSNTGPVRPSDSRRASAAADPDGSRLVSSGPLSSDGDVAAPGSSPVATGAADPAGSEETVLLLPQDPDRLAAQLRAELAAAAGLSRLGVVLADTAGRPWRHGQTDLALGAAGLLPLQDLRGTHDADGRALAVTATALADEIASAADLVRPKDAGVAAALVRGLDAHLVPESPLDADLAGARSLVRTGPGDWFALGHVEAVRAALGVPPGTAEAVDVGIPAVGAEDVTARLARAARLALRTEAVGDIPADHPRAPAAHHPVRVDDISCDVVQQGFTLRGPDALSLGVVAGRLLVALESEGLHGRIARHHEPTRPGSGHRLDIVLL